MSQPPRISVQPHDNSHSSLQLLSPAQAQKTTTQASKLCSSKASLDTKEAQWNVLILTYQISLQKTSLQCPPVVYHHHIEQIVCTSTSLLRSDL